jgi:hypothetical protein
VNTVKATASIYASHNDGRFVRPARIAVALEIGVAFLLAMQALQRVLSSDQSGPFYIVVFIWE